IVTLYSQAIQPPVNPPSAPKVRNGNRAVPPDTGYVEPSSAWTSAITARTAAPMIHEISDAPPATLAAVSAPSSQPDPIIVPRLIKVSPRSPTARCRCCSPAAVGVLPAEVFAMVFLQKVFACNGCCAVR